MKSSFAALLRWIRVDLPVEPGGVERGCGAGDRGLVGWPRGGAERLPERGLWTCGVVWERGLPEYARGCDECPPPRDPPPRCCAARGAASMVKMVSKQSDLDGITASLGDRLKS